MKYFFLIGFLFYTLFAPVLAQTRKNEDNLTSSFSQLRKKQVGRVEYQYEIHLFKNKNTYEAKAIILVELLNIGRALSIDLLTQKVHSLTVNDKLLNDYKKNKGSLEIPQKYLKSQNQITLTYTGEFNKEGTGFQRVQDSEDGKTYLYTDFEPYQAHQLFASFDQPDLKASISLKVMAPKEWKVISNELIESTQEGSGKAESITTFKKTPPLSPYLFFLGAGDFVEWKDEHEGIPLYLYARHSLAKYVDHENIMNTVKKGLSFYAKYFGTPYPFSKYGQVFIPEFIWGGMENPGAVTLNERGIYRGPVPQSKREGRDDLMLHEMAHMWFGDLVTMQWWNDLWLNESFATYAATLANDRALDAKGSWTDFFSTKTWGYWQDQLVTTHPIETSVSDVKTAKSNFDGITYAKGASALKQLHFLIGDESFQLGLKKYFTKFSWKNTTRSDFLGELSTASSQELNSWANSWLKSAGAHQVEVLWSCESDKVKEMKILQKENADNVLSPHKTRLALYNQSWEIDESLDAPYSTTQTEVLSVGKDCPHFVFPNQDDFDYALFSLDEKSLAVASDALIKIPDPLTRLMLWHILKQMVRDNNLAPSTFFDQVIPALSLEKEDSLLAVVIGRWSYLREVFNFLPENKKASYADQLENTLWSRVVLEDPGSDLQMIFYDAYIRFSQTQSAQDKILSILQEKRPPKGIVLDQDRRWDIILNLSRNGHISAQSLIDDELKLDNSSYGKRLSYGALVSMPSREAKEKFWKALKRPKDLPFNTLEQGADAFHHPNYPELSQKFLKEYFNKIVQMDWVKNEVYVEIYFESLFPSYLCTPEVLSLSRVSLKRARRLNSLAKRAWLEANDELERCVKIKGNGH